MQTVKKDVITNYKTSEKFNCQALKDQQNKKDNVRRTLLEELERRNCESIYNY